MSDGKRLDIPLGVVEGGLFRTWQKALRRAQTAEAALNRAIALLLEAGRCGILRYVNKEVCRKWRNAIDRRGTCYACIRDYLMKGDEGK